MIVFLRFIGVMNAAVWFGAVVCFTFAIAPALHSGEMKRLLGEIYAGIIAQLVAERYFALQYWCGGVALLHQLAEWVYLGRPWQRLTAGTLLAAFLLGLLGGLWFQPKLQRWHRIQYAKPELATPAQRALAARSFHLWNRIATAANLLVLGSLAVYTWRVAHPGNGPRFVPANKFRS